MGVINIGNLTGCSTPLQLHICPKNIFELTIVSTQMPPPKMLLGIIITSRATGAVAGYLLKAHPAM